MGKQNDADIGDGVRASLGSGGWSHSALEAALRHSANGAQSTERILRGVSRKGPDSLNQSLTENGAAGVLVKDRRSELLPDEGIARENGKKVEKGDRRSLAAGVQRQRGSVGAKRAVPTLAENGKAKGVDTKWSRVSGAWAQWLNGVSRGTGAPQHPEAVGGQDGNGKKLRRENGDRREGPGAPTRRDGVREHGPGEEYAETGVRVETGISGTGSDKHLGSGLAGLLTDLESELSKEGDTIPDSRDGRRTRSTEEGRYLETAAEQGAQLESFRLPVEPVPALAKNDARNANRGARSTGAEVTGPFEEGPQGRERPLLHRKPLQYERLSPSELFGAEPFELVVSGREDRGRQGASGKEEAWAAWQEFASGDERSPHEMSEFLAKWTAEHVAISEEAVSQRGARVEGGTKEVGEEYGVEGGLSVGSHGVSEKRAGYQSVSPRGVAKQSDWVARKRSDGRGRIRDASGLERPFSYEETSPPLEDRKSFESRPANGREVWQRSGGSDQGPRSSPNTGSVRSQNYSPLQTER